MFASSQALIMIMICPCLSLYSGVQFALLSVKFSLAEQTLRRGPNTAPTPCRSISMKVKAISKMLSNRVSGFTKVVFVSLGVCLTYVNFHEREHSVFCVLTSLLQEMHSAAVLGVVHAFCVSDSSLGWTIVGAKSCLPNVSSILHTTESSISGNSIA